jgi:CheY-like chemotaxis protein
MRDSPIHVLSDDLFFRSRIEATAEAAGVTVLVSRTTDELLARVEESGSVGVLVDLGMGADGPTAIRALKRGPDPPPVLAWGSHVETDTLEAARAAGADRVLARGAFTRRLPDLLRELAG